MAENTENWEKKYKWPLKFEKMLNFTDIAGNSNDKIPGFCLFRLAK